jgi:hypothetical protein
VVCDEGFICQFEGVVQWLGDIWKVGPEREFGDDMREVHFCAETGIYMSGV